MSIKVIELFAGVGGFRIGLERASNEFDTVWANQWEPSKKVQWAHHCYTTHFGKESCVNDNINTVKHDVPNHDLLVGGFPCQDYSVASTGAKGIEGKKGVLWWDIRDIIENRNPNYILLENVDRILKSPSSKRGRDFGIILKTLNDLGYYVEWRVINAAQYGCVQKRRRTFIFACKNNLKFTNLLEKDNFNDILLKDGFFAQPFPCMQNSSKKAKEFDFDCYNDLVELSNNFSNQFLNSGFCFNNKGFTMEVKPLSEDSLSLSTIVETDDVDSSYYLNDAQIQKFAYLRGSKKIQRYKPNGEPYFYSEGSMSAHDSLNIPARTILTSEGSINRSTHIIEDPKNGKLRLITQKECERLNGFPDDWTNTGMPQKFRYFCMGNALVVPLITKMGNRIIEIDKLNNS